MSFKDKAGAKPFIGQRKIEADEALGINFTEPDDILLVNIKLSALEENPFQPRKQINVVELNELKESIEQRGLLQPIVVRPNPNNPKLFQIIAGHRRTEAMRLLGRKDISAVIIKDQSRDMRIDALIENIQRVNLSSIDEAFAIKEIMESSNIKQLEVAKILGKSKNYVSRLLKIATLPPLIIKQVRDGEQISSSILSEISYMEDENLQNEVFKKVSEKNLSRDETRKLIDSLKFVKNKKKNKNEAFIFQKNKKNVSFKLDLSNVDAKKRAILELETLLKELKEEEL